MAFKTGEIPTTSFATAGFEVRESPHTTYQVESTKFFQGETRSALISLGYRAPEVKKAINLAITKMDETYELEDLIRTTLKEFAKG